MFKAKRKEATLCATQIQHCNSASDLWPDRQWYSRRVLEAMWKKTEDYLSWSHKKKSTTVSSTVNAFLCCSTFSPAGMFSCYCCSHYNTHNISQLSSQLQIKSLPCWSTAIKLFKIMWAEFGFLVKSLGLDLWPPQGFVSFSAQNECLFVHFIHFKVNPSFETKSVHLSWKSHSCSVLFFTPISWMLEWKCSFPFVGTALMEGWKCQKRRRLSSGCER